MPSGAAIINTAFVVAYKAPEILLDYATTKAGIITFTEVLAKQLIEKGIRVNAVAPGPFWTALQPSGGQPQEAIETSGNSIPLGRPGQPVQIAGIYMFLASQEASYVTGETYGATGRTGFARRALRALRPRHSGYHCLAMLEPARVSSSSVIRSRMLIIDPLLWGAMMDRAVDPSSGFTGKLGRHLASIRACTLVNGRHRASRHAAFLPHHAARGPPPVTPYVTRWQRPPADVWAAGLKAA